MKIIAAWQTRGGKYRIELSAERTLPGRYDNYRVEEFTGGRSTGTAWWPNQNLTDEGVMDRVEREKIWPAHRIDGINYTRCKGAVTA